MSLVVRSPLARAGLIAGSLASVAAAAATSRVAFLVLAVLLLLPIATSLSPAGRIAASLRSLRRRAVSAVVWGVPLLGSASAAAHVESVGALGAGLLIYLSHSGDGRTLLKVAQPRSWLFENGRLVIEDAAYVQWAGKRLARAQGVPAVTISPVASGAA
jgi:hypothetical protein